MAKKSAQKKVAGSRSAASPKRIPSPKKSVGKKAAIKKAAKKKVASAKASAKTAAGTSKAVSTKRTAAKKAVAKKVAVKKLPARKTAKASPTRPAAALRQGQKTSSKSSTFKQLASLDQAARYGAELTEIIGLIDGSGQSGWTNSNGRRVHCFSLAAWRRPGDVLVETTLDVLRAVPEEDETGDYFEDFPEGTIHHIRILLSIEGTRAVFFDAIQSDIEDDELRTIAERLKEPVIVESVRFGTLVLDRSIKFFKGNVEWNGTPITISFSVDDDLDLTPLLPTADKLFDQVAHWAKAVKDHAVQELLSLANDWNQDQSTPVTPDDFLRRMQLTSITIRRNGKFDFWHKDGNLFAGHSIQISGSLHEGLTRADIPG